MVEPRPGGRGPFLAEHLPEGSRYELSDGHPVYCAPAGRRHGITHATGVLPLSTDPAVLVAGVDVGFSPDPGTVRAPDVAVGGMTEGPGWAPGVPPLAVEYADTGTDEAELGAKIAQLLGAGTQQVWVVRLVGPRRVEVHRPGQPVEVRAAGQVVEAQGVLANALPVEALYDRQAALEVTLRNLLQRRGYASLDAVRQEGRDEGLEKGRDEGLAPLAHQFERKLGRPLVEGERRTLQTRLGELGPERLGDVVLDLARADLAAWLIDAAPTPR